MDEAERLLRSLGVRDVSDLDLPVIAHMLGLSIRVAPLRSCEARLVAAGQRGIITVREDRRPERQRFSIGHEIGHWRYHRHSVLMCQENDIEHEREAAKMREKVADRFASNLLMPAFMFVPMLGSVGRPSFELAMRLAGKFKVSVTAAARRIVALDNFPSVLVSYGHKHRNWFQAAPQLLDAWSPSFELDARSRGLNHLIERGRPDTIMRANASLHFSRTDATRYDVDEQFWSPLDGEVLGLLTFRKKPV